LGRGGFLLHLEIILRENLADGAAILCRLCGALSLASLSATARCTTRQIAQNLARGHSSYFGLHLHLVIPENLHGRHVAARREIEAQERLRREIILALAFLLQALDARR